MLLMVGSLPVTLSAQSQTQSQTPAASSAPSGSTDACLNSKSLMEQLKDSARISQQELQEQVSSLQKMAKEVEMNSPELAKLQGLSARLAGNQEQWEARAQELSSRAADLAAGAQEKAAEVWGQEPRVFTTTTDDGSGWLGVEIGEVTAEKAALR